MKWTTKQFAVLTGVSPRTLHYYDEIGLLEPAFVDEQSGYRYYDGASFGRMKQILFYRELDFSLEDIREILSASEQDIYSALVARKEQLMLKKERLERLIALLESVEQGEDLRKIMGSFEKESGTLDERTVTFHQLLEEADRLLENDTVNDGIVLVKTAKGNIYHTFNQAMTTDYNGTNDLAFMDMLLERDDAEVRYLIALWNPRVAERIEPESYALDVPGWCLRRGLLELAPGNEDALILLRGEGVYNVRTLKSIQPPQAGLDAEWKKICALRGADG